jgi:VanZ family protein
MLLRRLSLVSALAWMAVLFYLSHQPTLPTPSLFEGQDKVFHAGAYGLLGLLLLAAHRPQASGYSWHQVRTSALLASLYGISDEIHQAFVPGRSSDVLDWAADTVGALLATLLLAWLSRRYATSRIAPEGGTTAGE